MYTLTAERNFEVYKSIEERKNKALDELKYRFEITGRYNLDYGRLFFGKDGGYDIDELKKVLE